MSCATALRKSVCLAVCLFASKGRESAELTMEEERFNDHRDSTLIRQAEANRKGRGFTPQHSSQLSRDHVTPWGTAPTGEGFPIAQPLSPTRRKNHLQNAEAPQPQGEYRVPDPSPAHNHMQNAETTPSNDRLKMVASRINDSHIAFAPTNDLV
jgi:hypothetical protein